MVGRAQRGGARLAPVLTFLAFGCTVEGVGSVQQPVAAYCTAMVEGVGPVPVETEYLAGVVNCENGGAAFEALKVQAIAARTYLYYKMDTSGSIADGTSDQVYSCGRAPREEHYEAVRQTAGMVLQYEGETIAGFYVAGSRNQPPPECRGSTDDPTNTERFVTYNEGRSGDEVEQTTLGWVNPRNIYNRGCMSQNGSHCLASQGWAAEDIVRFYYGADIAFEVAEGDCVDPVDAGVMDAGVMDAGGDDAGAPAEDASLALDAGAPDGGASVGVIEPPEGVRPLTGGCRASPTDPTGPGALAGAFVLLLARRRRSPHRSDG